MSFTQRVFQFTSTTSSLTWIPEAKKVFTRRKEVFTSAPVLSHPGPSRQFIVEADVSDTVVGAGLSQQDPVDQKLHPCAFFSQRLSPAERNNDVGIMM